MLVLFLFVVMMDVLMASSSLVGWCFFYNYFINFIYIYIFSMLYNRLPVMSFQERMQLYPVLQRLVDQNEATIHHSVIK